MFNSWRLVRITQNIEGGEAQEIKAYTDEKSCYDAFYNQLSQYGTNPSTAKCECMVIAPSGKVAKLEQIDNTRYEV